MQVCKLIKNDPTMMHKQLQQQLKEVKQARALQSKPLLSETELRLHIAKQSAALVEACSACTLSAAGCQS